MNEFILIKYKLNYSIFQGSINSCSLIKRVRNIVTLTSRCFASKLSELPKQENIRLNS